VGIQTVKLNLAGFGRTPMLDGHGAPQTNPNR
jgi:hypothetical protein